MMLRCLKPERSRRALNRRRRRRKEEEVEERVQTLPNKYDIAWGRYVTPFSYELWLAVAIAACARRVCLALINYGHERNQNLNISAILSYIVLY